MNKANLMCTICHQKNNNSYVHQLQKIKSTIRMHRISHDHIFITHNIFTWHINEKCKYGITCNELNRHNREAQLIVNEINPYLISIAIGDNDKLYHDILSLMRGYFPSIYTSMERLRHGGYKSCYQITERN